MFCTSSCENGGVAFYIRSSLLSEHNTIVQFARIRHASPVSLHRVEKNDFAAVDHRLEL